jgi:chemotaxis protein methyltransferase CheR
VGAEVAGFDLVLCRNVLIYFDAQTIRAVAQRLYAVLNEGGWLVTAPADPPLWDFAPFELQFTPGGIFYRRPSAGPTPAACSELAQPRRTVPPHRRTSAASQLGAHRTRRPAARPRLTPTAEKAGEAAAWIERIKASANLEGSDLAERQAVAAIARWPSDPQLRYLHSVLLLDLRRPAEAVHELRRTLYLDRSLVPPHLLLGAAFRRLDRLAEARRIYTSALRLCAKHLPDDLAPLGDGESFGRLAEAAAAELAALSAQGSSA